MTIFSKKYWTSKSDKDRGGVLPIYTDRGPLESSYLEAIKKTLDIALEQHPRTCAMRFDLHYPDRFDVMAIESNHVSKFQESLKAIIAADLERKKKVGRCKPRFVWVKEQNTSEKPHYHVVMLVNGDVYNQLGLFTQKQGNMAARIVQAWASALVVHPGDVECGVHFPDNPIYIVDKRKTDSFLSQYKELFYRLSYFAKKDTKQYGQRMKNFGCSRR
ncbi:inovirus Gp2 family protein [Vibrio harveyi]